MFDGFKWGTHGFGSPTMVQQANSSETCSGRRPKSAGTFGVRCTIVVRRSRERRLPVREEGGREAAGPAMPPKKKPAKLFDKKSDELDGVRYTLYEDGLLKVGTDSDRVTVRLKAGADVEAAIRKAAGLPERTSRLEREVAGLLPAAVSQLVSPSSQVADAVAPPQPAAGASSSSLAWCRNQHGKVCVRRLDRRYFWTGRCPRPKSRSSRLGKSFSAGKKTCILSGRVGTRKLQRITHPGILARLGQPTEKKSTVRCAACEADATDAGVPLAECPGGCGNHFCNTMCTRRLGCPHFESLNVDWAVSHTEAVAALGCQCACCERLLAPFCDICDEYNCDCSTYRSLYGHAIDAGCQMIPMEKRLVHTSCLI